MVFFANPNQLWIAIISLAVFGAHCSYSILRPGKLQVFLWLRRFLDSLSRRNRCHHNTGFWPNHQNRHDCFQSCNQSNLRCDRCCSRNLRAYDNVAYYDTGSLWCWSPFIIHLQKVNGVVESIWKTAFSVACALNLIAGVMFILFGDGSSSFLVVENTQLQLVIKDGEMKKGQGNREYTQSKGLRKENEIR